MENKNLLLERLVFFCDAVVAIAITLLVFNIKIERTANGHLTINDVLAQWKFFVAFLLSFLNIASFWKRHHSFFVYINKIDEPLLWFNISWLFFIVLLPFSTSLVSIYFFETTAVFVYSLNTFLIAVFQNLIWDYAALKPGYMKQDILDEETRAQTRLYCNLDMVNAAVAIGVSFIHPVLAFILLFTKLPMIVLARMYYRSTGQKQVRGIRRKPKRD